MKQDKVVSIVLTVVNMILIIVCMVLYLGTDRTEPRFVIQPAEVLYTPDLEDVVLCEGISAHDDRDGDITGQIVIEKKVENREEGTAIIYYAVSDAAGNIAKFSKLFPAEYPVEVSATVSDAGRESQEIQELERTQTVPDEGQEAGMEENPGQEAGAEENSEAEGVENGISEENDVNPGVTNPVNGGSAQGIMKPEATAGAGGGPQAVNNGTDSRADAAVEGNEEAEAEPGAAAAPENSGAPELVLRTTNVTINSGTNVPWTEIISTLRDDKDDYAALYYNLQVSQFNRNKPGTYPVTVYTEDSDGNRSQTVPVTIIVR